VGGRNAMEQSLRRSVHRFGCYVASCFVSAFPLPYTVLALFLPSGPPVGMLLSGYCSWSATKSPPRVEKAPRRVWQSVSRGYSKFGSGTTLASITELHEQGRLNSRNPGLLCALFLSKLLVIRYPSIQSPFVQSLHGAG